MKLLIVLCLIACAPLHAFAERKLSLSTLEWPPYTSQAQADGGYATAVVSAAFAAVGITVDVHYHPWARALEEARRGRVDGLFPEYFDPERRPNLLFSEPFPGGPAGLVKLRERDLPLRYGEPGSAGFPDLRGLKIGLVRGYLNHPLLDSDPSLRRDFARDDLQNLSKLMAGRVDLIFIDYLVAKALLREHFVPYRADIELIQPPLLQPTLHLVVSKQHDDALENLKAFNRGLQIIRDNGELQRLIEHHGL